MEQCRPRPLTDEGCLISTVDRLGIVTLVLPAPALVCTAYGTQYAQHCFKIYIIAVIMHLLRIRRLGLAAIHILASVHPGILQRFA